MKNEINLIMSQKQTFIRKVLQESDLPEAWLARKISVSPQKLSYMLHKSKTIDADLYDRIIQVLSPYIQQTENETVEDLLKTTIIRISKLEKRIHELEEENEFLREKNRGLSVGVASFNTASPKKMKG